MVALTLALLAAPLLPRAEAQTLPVEATDATGSRDLPATILGAIANLPWLQIGVLAGGSYLGSILARRFIDSTWFSLLGARLGAMIGLDALAGFEAIGEGAGAGAATVAPTTVAAPIPDSKRR
jgi:hypothetical protein